MLFKKNRPEKRRFFYLGRLGLGILEITIIFDHSQFLSNTKLASSNHFAKKFY